MNRRLQWPPMAADGAARGCVASRLTIRRALGVLALLACLLLPLPAAAQTFGQQQISDQLYLKDVAIADLTLPEATGGSGTLTYSLSPDPPDGLTFDAATRLISGAPTAVQTPAVSYTYKATDSSTPPGEAELTFTIEVQTDTSPTFGAVSVDDRTFIDDVTITDLVLPAATGGNAPLTYSLGPTPALPTGLTFDAATRTISGTPSAVMTETEYTLKVTDADGNTADTDAATLTFKITVEADTSPDFSTVSVDAQTFIDGVTITDLVLPAATGGNAPLTYSLGATPALPTGLTFRADTRTIAGAPTVTQTATTYTLTATDANGDTGTLTFDITVEADTAPSFGTATIADQTYTNGVAIADLLLPAATGGNAPLTYTLTPPAGLTFDADTRTVSGTPTETRAETTYTLTATDANGDSATRTFRITVERQLPAEPANVAATGGTAQLTVNWDSSDASHPLCPVSSWQLNYRKSGSAWREGWDVRPANPNNQDNGAFDVFVSDAGSGSPYSFPIGANTPPTLRPAGQLGVALDGGSYEVRLRAYSNSAGCTPAQGNYYYSDFTDIVSATVTAGPPTFGGATIPAQYYSQNTPIPTLNLPRASGGTLTYSLTQPLPAGLDLDTNARTVTGTPTETKAETEYTWRATDGSNTADVKFNITVSADAMPSFAGEAVERQSWYWDHWLILRLPAATGGNAPVTYSLAPALPAGLTFNAGTRTVSGTPSAAMAETTYTLTATDADGDTATLTFPAAVNFRPAAPTGLTATGGARRIEMSWSWADDTGGVCPLTRFRVYYYRPGEDDPVPRLGTATPDRGAFEVGKDVRSIEFGADDSLDREIALGDGEFQVAVQAFSLACHASRSDNHASSLYTVASVTVDPLPPDAPENLTATAGDTEVDLSWSNPNDGTITKYEVRWKASANLPFDDATDSWRVVAGSDATTTDHKVTGLANGTEYTFEVRAVNSAGDGAAASVAATPALNAPSFDNATIADQSYIENQVIADLVLPVATGGDGTLTYGLSPTLPAGLAFDADTRILAGTPTATMDQTTYTFTATDADGDTASLTFKITVEAAPTTTPTSADFEVDVFKPRTKLVASWTKSKSVFPFTPAGTRKTAHFYGVKVVTLPDTGTLKLVPTPDSTALERDAIVNEVVAVSNIQSKSSERVLAFFPPDNNDNFITSFTFKVIDQIGLGTDLVESAATYTATLKFEGSTPTNAPPTLANAIADRSVTVGKDVTVELEAAGGAVFNDPDDDALTYSASSSDEARATVSVDNTANTVTVTGVAAGTAAVTVTANDGNGGSVQDSFTITVEADTAPSFGNATIADQSYTRNEAITALVLPEASGGNGELSYTLTPTLPNGLTFTPPSGTTPGSISGMPTAVQAATDYSWTVTDRDDDTASLTFKITVAAAPTSANFTKEVFRPHTKLVASRGSSSVFPFTPADEDDSGALFREVQVVTLPDKGKLKTVPATPKSRATERDVSANQKIPVLDTQQSRYERVLAFFPPDNNNNFNTSFTFKVIDENRVASAATYTATLKFEGSTLNRVPNLNTSSVAQQTFTVGETVDREFPWSNTGDGKLIYTLEPELPAGLAYDGDGPDDGGVGLGQANAPHLTGTPVQVTAAEEYTLTVADTDSVTGAEDKDSVTFYIEVVASADPLTAPKNLAAAPGANTGEVDLSWDAIDIASKWQVRHAEGTSVPETVAWTDVPNSNATTTGHTVTGLANGTEYTFEVRAVNANNGPAGEVSLTLAGLVVSPTSLSIEANASGSFTVALSTAPSAAVTVAVTSDDTDVTVSPDSLDFTTADYATAKTVTVNMAENPADGAATVSLSATGGDYAGLSASVSVSLDAVPSFGIETIADQSYIENLKIEDLVLPVATGGDGTLDYTLTPAEADRPAGLVFTLPSGTTAGSIKGTPSEAKAKATYTLKARDLDGDEATLTFAITVEADTAPSFGNATIADQSYIENQAITALVLPEATGGNGTLSYTVTPTLPTGLAFAPATRTITGAATVTQTATTYTLKARDQDGDEATLTFTITVNADVPPSFGTKTIADQSYTRNQAITALVLPEATGGNGALSYSLNPAPPAGLTFTPPSGTTPGSISGTPTATMDETTYSWTAADADANSSSSDQATLTFTITVAAAPTFSQTIADQNWFRTYRIEDVQLPAASGGNGALTYTLTPALPDGLIFDARARTISGTPTTATPETTYTLTATDSSTSPARAELTFRGVVGFTPAAPTNVTAEGGSRRITVRWNWQDDTGGVCPALDFGLYYLRPDADLPNCDDPNTGDVGCFLVVADSNNTDYTFTFGADHSLDEYIALGDGKFEIWLTAYSRDCEETEEFPSNTPWSQYFHPIPDVTVLPGPPAEPTGLAATPGDRQVTLAWNNPNDSTITKYQLRWKASASLPFDDATDSWSDVTGSGATTTGHTVTGLANGTEYTFEVRAVNGDGGGAAASVAATPEGIPDAPIDLKAAAGDTQVTLTWKLPTNAGRIDRVELRWKASASLPFVDATDSWTDLNDATATTYKVTGLTNGTGYTFQVRAANSAGDGAAASVAATPNAPPTVANEIADRIVTIGAPVIIALEDANNPVFTDPDGDDLSYEVSSSDATKATVTYDSGAESITVTGVASSRTDTVTITVTADDGNGGSVSDEFAVTVNAPPTVANEIADRTLNVSATVTIQLEDANNPVFTDPDDSSLTYTASSGDTDKATVAYNSGAESITVTGVASSGTDTVTITVTASDGRGGSVSDEFAVTVTAQNPTNNDPTVANEIADRIVTIGAPVIIALEDANNPVFTDPDGDDLSYEVSSSDATKATVTYDSGAESITVTGVASSRTDTVTITVTADDGNGGSVSDEFAVTVNAPPTVANEIADRTLNVSATVTIQLEDANNPVFTDPDDSSLTYTASSGDTDKATVAYNSGAESITVTGVASSGTDTVTITVTASDGRGGSVSDEFAVTVTAQNPTNNDPTVANEIADRIVTIGAPVIIALEDANNPVFTDPDGDDLSYEVSSSDATKATVTYDSGAESITVTGVASSRTDTVTITVTADDGNGGSVSDEFAVTVNAPPTVANEIADRTLNVSATVTIQLEDANNPVFTDPDDSSLTYTASSGDTDKATVAYNSGAESITVTGVASSGTDTVTITVTASDGRGGSVSDEFAVTVTAQNPTNNDPTVANEIADRIVTIGAPVIIALEDANNPVFTDPDGDDLSYEVSSSDATKATVTYDSGAESITVTGVASSRTDTVTITVTADDGNGGSVSDEFAVTVNAPPTVANEIADRTLNVSATVTIQLEDANNPVFTDPDDSSLTYTASSGDTDKATVAYNSGAESITVTGVASSGTDTVTITVTASDGRGGSVSDEFAVTVTAQNPTNNDPTVANEIADRIVTIGAPVIIALEDANNPVFTDPDGDDLSYEVSSSDATKATVTYDSGAESITVTGVASSRTDTVTITVTADDGNGGSVSDEFAVTVNAPPTVANEIADRTLNVSATVTIQLEDANNPVFTDPDDSSLTYTASSGDTDKATVAYNSGAESITVTGVASSGTDTVTITVTASDGRGGSVSDEFAVTVTAQNPTNNDPTVANEIADRIVTIGAPVIIALEDANNPVFTDPDGDDLSYEVSSSDATKATVTYDSGAESITVTGVASSRTDTVTITVTADDGNGGSVSDEFAVTVNAPPTVANEIADRTLNVSATVTIQLEDANNPVFTDPDDSSLTYTASSGDTDKATVAYNSGAESITVTGVASSGTDTVTITVTASDGRGGSVSDEFAVTVTAQNPTNNDPTVANEIADRIVTIGAPVIIALEDANNPVFTDPDGDDLSYEVSSSDATKATVTYDSGAESITVTGVASSRTDTVTITVTADDGNGGSVSDEFAVTVNAPPTVANEIADRTLNVSATVTIQLEDANNPVFTDPDDSSLTYTASSGDTDKATVAYNSGAESITVTGVASSGTDTVTITVTASDGRGGSVSDEFAVTVTAQNPTNNDPTVANEIADRIVTIGAPVIIALEDANNPVFTDPDGDDLSYEVSSSDATKATVTYDSGAESITVTGVASSRTDTVTITVTADDGNGGSVSDEFAVTVNAPPTVANEIADRTLNVSATVTIQLEDANNPVFTDPDDSSLTYTASSGDTDKATVAYNSGAESITVTGVASSGTDTVTITVTASDGRGGSVSDEFAVTVTAQNPTNNDPTVANEIADRIVTIGAPVIIALEDANNPVFTDPDGDDLSYEVSSSDATKATVTYDSGAESITVTGVASSRTDTVTITVTADDGNGGSVSDEFAVTVNAPPTVANEIADRTLNVSATVTIQLEDANNPVFTDPDDSSLTYTASSGDTDKATVAYNSGAESITVTGVASSGTDTVTITVTASDGRGGSVSDEFAVTVTADDAPSFGNAAIADQTYSDGVTITDLTLPVATGGNGTLTYTLTPEPSDRPAGLVFTLPSGTTPGSISGTPTETKAEATYTLTATDRDGDADTLTFTITVTAPGSVNNPPTVVRPIGNRIVNVGATLTIRLERSGSAVFNDADGHSLSYRVVSNAADKATARIAAGNNVVITGVAAGTATVTVTADDGNGGSVSDSFTVTVTATEGQTAGLTEPFIGIGRATLRSAMDLTEWRSDTGPGDPSIRLAGERIDPAPRLAQASGPRWIARPEKNSRARSARKLDPEELLLQSSLGLSLGDGGGADWSVWGRGDVQRFRGGAGALRHVGKVETGWLGLDARFDDDLLAGMTVARSTSRVTLNLDGDESHLETALTAAYPYLLAQRPGGGGWRLIAGAGSGEAELLRPNTPVERADLSLRLASVGGRWPVATSDGFQLAVSGDAGMARLETRDATGRALSRLEATVWQLRGGLEVEHDGLALPDSTLLLTPSGSLVLRHDGGDGATGTGVEVALGLRLAAPGARFGLDASGHWLALHSTDGYRSFGGAIEARLAPDAQGRGLSFSIGPQWGARQTGLLELGDVFHGETERAPGHRSLSARTHYGFRVGRDLLSPFVTMELGEFWRRYETGVEARLADGVNATLAGERQIGDSDAETVIRLNLGVRF